MLKIHWVSLIKTHKSVLTENMQSLAGLKQMIKQKSANLSDMLQLQGKLDMLKTTYSLDDPLSKYAKIKTNLLKDGQQEVLVYQDQSDDDENLDQAMQDFGDDSEMGESEFDEEIMEVGVKKR